MFLKALEITPDHIPSIYHLGLMQHKNNELKEALNSFSSVLNAIGDDRLVYESRGLVFYDMKNYNAAIADFNKTIEIEATYADNYYHRGLCYIEIQLLKDAIEDFNQAIALGSKNPGIYSGIG